MAWFSVTPIEALAWPLDAEAAGWVMPTVAPGDAVIETDSEFVPAAQRT